MFALINKSSVARKWILASAAAVSLGGAFGGSSTAMARDRARVDVDIRIGEPAPRHEPVFEERRIQVWVPAEYRTVNDRRWIEPTYRTVSDRRWIEPVYENRCDRVWAPEVSEIRETRRFDHGRTITTHERVVISPAHFESRETRVCVAEGRWENFDRQECLIEGHWETFDRQEEVCAGHYETRVERHRISDRPVLQPWQVVNPGLAGIRGR